MDRFFLKPLVQDEAICALVIAWRNQRGYAALFTLSGNRCGDFNPVAASIPGAIQFCTQAPGCLHHVGKRGFSFWPMACFQAAIRVDPQVALGHYLYGLAQQAHHRTDGRHAAAGRQRARPCRLAALPPCRLAALPPCRLAALGSTSLPATGPCHRPPHRCARVDGQAVPGLPHGYGRSGLAAGFCGHHA